MVAGHARGAHLILVAAALIGLAVAHVEAADPDRDPRWPLVSLPHPVAQRVLVGALDVAAARLAGPDCAKVLDDFAAFTTRDLSERLVSLQTSLQRYLALVVFMDDSRHRRCRGGAMALTEPGSRVVRVCGDALARPSLDSEQVVAMVIHETLHSLGLPENPPSSIDITKRVLVRCGSPK